MAVYRLDIEGADKPRLVKAPSAAKAVGHVVKAAPLTAEKMALLLADGIVLEAAQ